MRDVGALLWVAIVIAGVLSTIASSLRKQAAARAQTFRPPPGRAAPSLAPNVPVARPSRANASPAKPKPQTLAAPEAQAQPWGILHTRELPETHKQATRTARSLFGRRSGLIRAIVASEVLGKPHALRDEA